MIKFITLIVFFVLSSANADNISDLVPKAFPHRRASDFSINELILTRGGAVGEVMGIKDNKVYIDGKFVLTGFHSPEELVKLSDKPLRGLRVGSLISDGYGGWGKVVRIWEDGRLEIFGKWFSSAPTNINQLNPKAVAEAVPPQETIKKTLFGKFCSTLLGG